MRPENRDGIQTGPYKGEDENQYGLGYSLKRTKEIIDDRNYIDFMVKTRKNEHTTSAMKPLPLQFPVADHRWAMVVETRMNAHPWTQMLVLSERRSGCEGVWSFDPSEMEITLKNI